MIWNNITFDGFHCLTDMGLIYVPVGAKPIVAPQSVHSYIIGGAPGTAAYGDQQTLTEYRMTGIFYPARNVDNELEAQRLWRRTAQWLGVGRRQLILDSEPDKYIIAEVQQMDNDEYGWIDGGLQVTWLCQPFHWVRYPDVLKLNLTGTVTADWHVETSLPAPVDASIINNGEAAIVAATVNVSGRIIAFEGLELLPGSRLDVSMMTPVGAVITDAEGITVSAMPYMTAFEQLQAKGEVSVDCSVAFSGTDGSAELQLIGHGCWR